MKNIHLLETDKDSNLFIGGISGKLHYNYSIAKGNSKNQFIYVTNDDKLNDNQYCISYGSDTCHGKVAKFNSFVKYSRNPLKIVLTNDTKLIVKGVQEIDEEFLDWFVKNPNCEEVEVDNSLLHPSYKYFRDNILENKNLYKIIIPRKGKVMEIENNKNIIDDSLDKNSTKEIRQKVEHKGKSLTTEEVMEGRSNAYNFLDFKETVEEAAEKFVNNTRLRNPKSLFCEGVKWQQKRSYSEEDLLDLLMFIEVPKKKSHIKEIKSVLKEWVLLKNK